MTNYNNPLDDELRVDQLFCLYNLYNDPQTSFHLKNVVFIIIII